MSSRLYTNCSSPANAPGAAIQARHSCAQARGAVSGWRLVLRKDLSQGPLLNLKNWRAPVMGMRTETTLPFVTGIWFTVDQLLEPGRSAVDCSAKPVARVVQ